MKVFISWSGERSKFVARVLKGWLKEVIQGVDPWMSELDIDAGNRWNSEIDKQLSATNFGIICLTAENYLAPWIHFEAGALAKQVQGYSQENPSVCPYLIGVRSENLPQGPLSQFQAKYADEKGTFEIVKAINKVLGNQGLLENQLERTFAKWWPDLEFQIGKALEIPVQETKQRTMDEMVVDILDIVRVLR